MQVTLPSGAILDITVASFQDAMALQREILKSIKGIPLEANVFDTDVTSLKDAVISAATSEGVEKALFACLRRVSYENVPVTPELFDDPKLGGKARKDFYSLAWEVIKENCGPFFVETFSRLKKQLGTQAVPQKLPSTATKG